MWISPKLFLEVVVKRKSDSWDVHAWLSQRKDCRIGSLRYDDDDDGNQNGKKAIGLDKQNNNFAREKHAFFVHFSAIVAWLQRETAYFPVLSRTGTKDNNFLFLFLNFDAVL